MHASIFHMKRRAILTIVGIYVAYLLTGLVGLQLYSATLNVRPILIWLPLGISVAAVLLEGYIALIPIALGAITIAIINSVQPLPLAAATVVAHVAQAYVFGFIFRTLHAHPRLETLRDMALLLATGFFATAVFPSIRSAAIYLYNAQYGTEIPITWTTWWVGNALSVLIIVPLLLGVYARAHRLWRRPRLQNLELIIALVLLSGVSVFLFGTLTTAVGGISLLFPLLVMLTWISLRFGVIPTGIGLLLMTAISIGGALIGTYVMPLGGIHQRLLNVQIFDLIMVVFFLILASVEEQRRISLAEQVQNAEQLKEALEKLHKQEDAKNEFIAILAHELRNPLALMDNSMQLLRIETKDHVENTKLIDTMLKRVHTMARLLDDLLDISRITQNKITIKSEVIDMRGIAQHAIENMRSVVANRMQTLQGTVPSYPLWVRGDPTRLEQVMLNLLINAAKYTPDGGRIVFTLAKSDGYIVIRVADNGIGIPSDMLTQVFEPFVQISRPYKMPGVSASLGVGLSVTKRLVELHGGSIEAQSAGLNQGSEFTIRLPVHEHSHDESKLPRQAAENREQQQQKLSHVRTFDILVVDDESAIADGFKKLLEQVGGHTVRVAYNGKDAIQRMKEHAADVVILDIGLPDMDGYTVARALKKEREPTFLIALSGYGQEKDKEKARQAGFDEYLVKPAGIAAVERILSTIPS